MTFWASQWWKSLRPGRFSWLVVVRKHGAHDEALEESLAHCKHAAVLADQHAQAHQDGNQLNYPQADQGDARRWRHPSHILQLSRRGHFHISARLMSATCGSHTCRLIDFLFGDVCLALAGLVASDAGYGR